VRLILTRDLFGPEATLGRLAIVFAGGTEPAPFGFTCEDQDRGLHRRQPLTEIARIKVRNETAIPAGDYSVRFTWSPKYHRNMLEVIAVPGFRGIRIHAGNDEADTAGCILPGLDRAPGVWTVGRSRAAVNWLEREVAGCEARREAVTLEITRDPDAWAAHLAGA
jgi:hypothetical protein